MIENPYEPSGDAVDAPKRSAGDVAVAHAYGTKLLASVALGIVSGGAIAVAALVAGFHGNAPVVWLYLCGPVAWLFSLTHSDHSYLMVLTIATPALWGGYWLFALMARTPPTALGRLSCIAGVHLVSAGTYHIAVGFG